MYHISETRKQNAQKRADLQNASDSTFCVLRHGGVLLKSGTQSKTLDDKSEVASFLDRVRDKGTGIVRDVVKSYFTPVTA